MKCRILAKPKQVIIENRTGKTQNEINYPFLENKTKSNMHKLPQVATQDSIHVYYLRFKGRLPSTAKFRPTALAQSCGATGPTASNPKGLLFKKFQIKHLGPPIIRLIRIFLWLFLMHLCVLKSRS
jgi:hypothetical protein